MKVVGTSPSNNRNASDLDGAGGRSPMPLPRRPVSLFMWPFGVSLTAWSYIWRTTPIHRRELPGSVTDLPPATPAGMSPDGVQLPEHGVGPLFHRPTPGGFATRPGARRM